MPNVGRIREIRSVAACCVVALLAACSNSVAPPNAKTPSGGGTEPTAPATLPRNLSSTERSLIGDANAFTFALWRELTTAQPDSNLFVSPLSASYSLAMAMNGAADGTLDDMRTGLQLGDLSVSDANAGYHSLITLLTSLDPSTTLQIANSIWYRNTFAVNQRFIDTTKAYFDASVASLDFADVPGSLARINGWVDSTTHGRIPAILEDIDRDDMMFLINAIYFKGSWRLKFDSSLTTSASFHGAHGDRTVPMMHKTDVSMSYAETPAYQVVELPYGDSTFSMTIVVPTAASSLATVAASLTPSSWSSLTASLHADKVTLSLPRFTMSWERSLIPDLEALGMRAPFSDAANFSALSPSPNLVISKVKQKAWVQVDESGTEAAAVTSTGVTATAEILPKVVNVDHPFIFAIRERLTGAVLFVGRVSDITS